jgi:hypothetical protein
MQPKELSTARKTGLGLTLREMTWVGKVFYKSGMFTDTRDEAVAIVKIMAGQEIGLPPFEAMTGINLIKGRPTLAATTIASKIKGSRKYDYRVKVATELKSQIDFYEVEPDGKRTMIGSSTFTIEQAQQAGLTGKDNWKAYPEDMLFARNISRGARRFTPDVFGAPVYTADEIDEETNPSGLNFLPSGTTPAPAAADNDEETETPAAQPEKPIDEPPEGGDDEDLDDSVADTETPEREPLEPIELPKPVDDDFQAEVLSDIAALDLSDIEQKRFLKSATGKITAKNLNEYEWRSLRSAVDIAKEEGEADAPDTEE